MEASMTEKLKQEILNDNIPRIRLLKSLIHSDDGEKDINEVDFHFGKIDEDQLVAHDIFVLAREFNGGKADRGDEFSGMQISHALGNDSEAIIELFENGLDFIFEIV